MRQFSLLASVFGLCVSAAACGGKDLASAGQSTEGLVLDVRCGQDSECPVGFQCEVEVEHGQSKSQCVGHSGGGNRGKGGQDDGRISSPKGNAEPPSTSCPAGYEVETEHGSTTCKAHRSADAGTGKERDGSRDGRTDGGNDAAEVESETPGIDDDSKSDSGKVGKSGEGDDAGSPGAVAEADSGDDRSDAGLGSADSGERGTSCTTDADCGVGLECETEVEHGISVSRCKAHKGSSK